MDEKTKAEREEIARKYYAGVESRKAEAAVLDALSDAACETADEVGLP